jgi:hypothetical protein
VNHIRGMLAGSTATTLSYVDMVSRPEDPIVKQLRLLMSDDRSRRDLEALRRIPLGWLLVMGPGGTGKSRFGVTCALIQTAQGLKGNLCAPTHVATTRLNDTVHDLVQRLEVETVRSSQTKTLKGMVDWFKENHLIVDVDSKGGVV